MAIRVLGGVSFRGAGPLVRQILNYYPGNHGPLYITSSYRPHSTGSHHQTGNAVDVASAYPSNPGPMKDVARWLMQFSGDLTELIHSNGNYFVKNGRRVGNTFYSSAVRANHWNHVHVAMTTAQANRVLARLRRGGGSTGGSSSTNGPAGAVRSVGSQQKEVNAAGYTPKLVQDGLWGPKTEAGVKWYQRRIGVTADGIWGSATDAAHRRYKDGGSSSSSSGSSSSGSRRSVLDQQKGHNYLRYLKKDSYRLDEDGIWGPKTEAGVKWVQRESGTAADGIWGPATESAYMTLVNRLKGSGSSGSSSPKKEGLVVDGLMGRATTAALQRALGVKDDGIIGPVTIRALQKKIGARQDGLWGTETTRKLQQYLNRI